VAAFQYQSWLTQKASFGVKFKELTNCTKKSASSTTGGDGGGDEQSVMECLRALPAAEAIRAGENAAGAFGPGAIVRCSFLRSFLISKIVFEIIFETQWVLEDTTELPTVSPNSTWK
jgi:hypothetical protein